MKKISAALSAIALFVGTAGVAHADGYLTPGEEDLGDAVSDGLCEYIQINGVTSRSMTEVFDIIYQQPEVANGGDVADVVNYVVSSYCPEYWRELTSFGEGYRN